MPDAAVKSFGDSAVPPAVAQLTVTVLAAAGVNVTVNGIGVKPPLPSRTLESEIEIPGGGLTVIVKVCAALVSTPPLAVPPLSCSGTVTVADAVGVGRRRVGQRAGRRDRRLRREQRVVAVADDEVERSGRSRPPARR